MEVSVLWRCLYGELARMPPLKNLHSAVVREDSVSHSVQTGITRSKVHGSLENHQADKMEKHSF